MRFVRANIFGFGKWIDYSFTFPKEQGIISLYGENESGKSTFQQFILYMLFDLPPKKRRFYQPKTSSKFGGQLTIVDDKIGTFTLERTGEQFICSFPDGKTEDDEWFASYVEGISRDLYEAIYSFSAEQLENIRQIKHEELSDVLFSIGISGATAVYETENVLTKEMDQIFKPQGTNPLLNKQIIKVNTLQTNMVEQRLKEQNYAALMEEKHTIEQEMEQLEQLVRHSQEQLLFFKQIDHLLPSIFSFKEHQEKLKHIPSRITFPEQGIQRYEQLKRELIPIKTKHESLQNMIGKLSQRRQEIEETIAPLSVYHEAEQLIKQRQSHEDLANQLHMLSIEVNQINEQMREQAQFIDAPIDMIEGKRFPLQVQKEWEEIARKEVDITQLKRQLKEEEKYAANQVATITEQIKMAETNVYPEDKMREMREKVKAHEDYKRIQREYEQRQSVWNTFQVKRKGLATKALLGCLIVGLLLVVSYFLFDTSSFLILGIAALVGGVVIYFAIQSTMTQIHGMLTDNQKTEMPISDVIRIEYDRKINEQNEWKQRLTGLVIEKENMEKKIAGLESRMSQYDVAYNILQDRIAKHRAEYPVLSSINPVHWSGLFDSIQKIKGLNDEKMKKVEQQQMLKSQFDQIDNQLQQYAQFIGDDAGARVTMIALEKWMLAFDKHREQLEEDQRTQNEYQRDQQQLKEQMNVIQSEIEQLYAYANVRDEEEFYRADEQYRSLKESEKIVSQFNNHLTHAFSEDMQREILENHWSEQSVQVNIERLESKQQDAQVNLSTLQKKLAEIEHAMKEQELSEELSKVTFAYEAEKEQLQSLAEKWLVYKVAHQSLQNAKMNYQEKYLNQIIELTTRYFAKMTNNEYVQVFPPSANSLFEVEQHNGIRFDVTQLSKGTVDQLYIALRLAIGYVMSEKYDVPFIIDDAFVHFDNRRTAATIEIMQEIAEDKQIILFTCHQDVATLTNAIPLTKQSSFIS